MSAKLRLLNFSVTCGTGPKESKGTASSEMLQYPVWKCACSNMPNAWQLRLMMSPSRAKFPAMSSTVSRPLVDSRPWAFNVSEAPNLNLHLSCCVCAPTLVLAPPPGDRGLTKHPKLRDRFPKCSAPSPAQTLKTCWGSFAFVFVLVFFRPLPGCS